LIANISVRDTRQQLGHAANWRGGLGDGDRDLISAEIMAKHTGILNACGRSREGHTLELARQLEASTGLESRLTILGHLQRGGTPSAGDRLLAARLGAACADLIDRETYGVMVAARGESVEPVPLEAVAGQKKLVPRIIRGWRRRGA